MEKLYQIVWDNGINRPVTMKGHFTKAVALKTIEFEKMQDRKTNSIGIHYELKEV